MIAFKHIIKNNNNFYYSRIFCVMIFLNSGILCFKQNCGIPGHSVKSSIKQRSNERSFKTNTRIKYSCDFNDAPFLIGESERVCDNGVWKQRMPLCASLYAGFYKYDFTSNGNAINITLPEPAKISGLSIKISSLEPIEVVNIINVNSPECFVANVTHKESTHSRVRKLYSTLFHCPSKSVDISALDNVSWILITFNEKFKNCELISCPAFLEYIELYEVVNDQCFTPDLPPFSKLIFSKINQTVQMSYVCDDYFAMKDIIRRKQGSSISVYCSEEKWNPKQLPECMPNITCNIDSYNGIKTSSNFLWNDREAVVGTITRFECEDNATKLTGMDTRECLSNGKWSGDAPECVSISITTEPITEATTTTTIRPEKPTRKYFPKTTIETTTVTVENMSPNDEGFITIREPSNVFTQMPQTTSTLTNIINENTIVDNSSKLGLNLTYIFLGLFMGITIAVCIIYYINRKRENRKNSANNVKTFSTRSKSQTRDSYDDIEVAQNRSNSGANYNQRRFNHIDSTDPEFYDQSGYIQIEAVEAMTMNELRKCEGYERNLNYKPIPKKSRKLRNITSDLDAY